MSVTSASAAPQELRRRDGGGDAMLLAHALFHHGAALGGVGVLVADEHAVFVVLVAGDHVGVAGDAGDDARRDAALGDLVALVGARACCAVGGDQFAAIDGRVEVELARDRR